MSDLRNLIETLGREESITYLPFPEAFRPHWTRILMAAHGEDLNSAKVVHEALLPGWDANIDIILGRSCEVNVDNDGDKHVSQAKDPARAWIIAILKAYEATNAGS